MTTQQEFESALIESILNSCKIWGKNRSKKRWFFIRGQKRLRRNGKLTVYDRITSPRK